MAGHNGAILMAYAQGDEDLIASGVSSLLGWLHQIRADHAVTTGLTPEVWGSK
jgi:hypothetical protein